MRKQEFNSKLISLLPLDEVPVHVPLRRPRPLRFERLRVRVESIQPRPPRPCEVGRPKGRRRKSRRQSHKFFKHRRSGWHPNSPPRPGGLPTPPPLPENLLLRLHRKLPSEPPASTQEVSESATRPATRGTAHSAVHGLLAARLVAPRSAERRGGDEWRAVCARAQ